MRINVLHPAFWDAHGHWPYRYQIPHQFCHRHGIEFVFNDPRQESDFVIVHEDVDVKTQVVVNAGGLILVTGEEQTLHSGYNQEFLDQFDIVITSRGDIVHKNVHRTHYWHPWRIKQDYDTLVGLELGEKSKRLSAIISNFSTLPLQAHRLEFIKKAKSVFGNTLDWFSKGQATFIKDKFDGLYPYKYSIAIENSSHQNYFTEKISDCFLSYTMPIYQGCPNISDYFDERSFVRIDVEQQEVSLDTIRDVIAADLFGTNIKYIEESRRLVLEKYQFLAALGLYTIEHPTKPVKVRKVLRTQKYFSEGAFGTALKEFVQAVRKKIN